MRGAAARWRRGGCCAKQGGGRLLGVSRRHSHGLADARARCRGVSGGLVLCRLHGLRGARGGLSHGLARVSRGGAQGFVRVASGLAQARRGSACVRGGSRVGSHGFTRARMVFAGAFGGLVGLVRGLAEARKGSQRAHRGLTKGSRGRSALGFSVGSRGLTWARVGSQGLGRGSWECAGSWVAHGVSRGLAPARRGSAGARGVSRGLAWAISCGLERVARARSTGARGSLPGSPEIS